jgi:phosphoenolpyruvate synthase/pyruvate phosphate dikinase
MDARRAPRLVWDRWPDASLLMPVLVAIEAHYGQPMDMEWAKDGENGELYIVQARPETVQSQKDVGTLKAYRLKSKGRQLVSGLAVGDSIAVGKVCRLESPDEIEIDVADIPKTQTQVMVNLANPAAAFRWWPLPSDGVGLARTEFIIGNMIKIHPMALVHYDDLEDKKARREIDRLTRGWPTRRSTSSVPWRAAWPGSPPRTTPSR